MHTKGDWVVRDSDIFLNLNGVFTGYKLARVQRAVFFEVKLSKEEVAANAHLMAASPNMFDVLEVALRRLEEKSDHSIRDIGLINKIRNVLAKAKGE